MLTMGLLYNSCCLVVLRPDEELSELESLSMTTKTMFSKREKVQVLNTMYYVVSMVWKMANITKYGLAYFLNLYICHYCIKNYECFCFYRCTHFQSSYYSKSCMYKHKCLQIHKYNYRMCSCWYKPIDSDNAATADGQFSNCHLANCPNWKYSGNCWNTSNFHQLYIQPPQLQSWLSCHRGDGIQTLIQPVSFDCGDQLVFNRDIPELSNANLVEVNRWLRFA